LPSSLLLAAGAALSHTHVHLPKPISLRRSSRIAGAPQFADANRLPHRPLRGVPEGTSL